MGLRGRLGEHGAASGPQLRRRRLLPRAPDRRERVRVPDGPTDRDGRIAIDALPVVRLQPQLYPGVGQIVQFVDTSTGDPDSWQWDFGDGTTSRSKNPTHADRTRGFFTVALTVGSGAVYRSAKHTVTVAMASTMAASFGYSPVSPVVGQTVTFTDASTGAPTSWSWSFGDGGTSSSQNPTHVYTEPGVYTATLTVADGTRTNTTTRTVTVTAAPVASFSYSPASPIAGQAVTFTDTSTGAPTSWSWSFGDGGTSTTRNPSHAFGGRVLAVSLTDQRNGSNGRRGR